MINNTILGISSKRKKNSALQILNYADTFSTYRKN